MNLADILVELHPHQSQLGPTTAPTVASVLRIPRLGFSAASAGPSPGRAVSPRYAIPTSLHPRADAWLHRGQTGGVNPGSIYLLRYTRYSRHTALIQSLQSPALTCNCDTVVT
jgi:hypothetical protein